MELISFLLAILASPFKAVARIGRAVFAKSLRGVDVLGVPSAVFAHFTRQSITDTDKFSMVLLPQNGNNNTSYALVTKFVDMQGFDFVDFGIMLGAIDVSIDAKAQESVNADGSSASDISGGAITQVGATSDNRLVFVSVRKTTMTKRYCGIAINVPSGTTNNVSVFAVRYSARGNLPVAQEAAGSNSYITAEVIKV